MSEDSKDKSVSLCCLEPLQEGIILNYEEEKLAKELISMGLLPGQPVKLLRKIWTNGNYYLQSNDQRIVIGHAEAEAIQVRIKS